MPLWEITRLLRAMEAPAYRVAKFACSPLPHFSSLQRGRRVSLTWDTHIHAHAHTHAHTDANSHIHRLYSPLCHLVCVGRLWWCTWAQSCFCFIWFSYVSACARCAFICYHNVQCNVDVERVRATVAEGDILIQDEGLVWFNIWRVVHYCLI